MSPDDFIWTEKYRPRKVEDCILPVALKKRFSSFVENRNFPNLILTGTPGIGKTTVAMALAEELDLEYIKINASSNRNIDLIRTTITNYSNTTSMDGKDKCIILDEADGMNAESAQPALRGAMEEFSHVRFILTCNYEKKLIEPIHSRTSVIEFSINSKAERDRMMVGFVKRLKSILTSEKISFDDATLVAIVKDSRMFPDFRRILNFIQSNSTNGSIDPGCLSRIAGPVDELVQMIKGKQLGEINKWFANNPDFDSQSIVEGIYFGMKEHIEPSSIPIAIETICDFQSRLPFAANHQIHLTGMFVRLMGEVEFK